MINLCESVSDIVLGPFFQRELLRAELAGADRVLAAGQRVVTWSPAALTHFSTCCRGVVEHVRSIATRLIG